MKNNDNSKAVLTYNIETTAKRLREVRERLHLSQKQAAERLGIERKSLSAIECGLKGCSVDLLIRMSGLYGISLDYLLLGGAEGNEEVKIVLENVISQLETLRRSL